MAKIELEAWFISKDDKAHYPSGPLGVTIHRDHPFKVTHPTQIKFFNDVANHNTWLTKITPEEAIQKLGLDQSEDIDDEEYLSRRALAEEKIDGLNKDIDFLKSALADKDNQILKLEGHLSEAAEYKEKYDESQAEIAKLDKTLRKLKKKLAKNGEEEAQE